MYLYYSAFEILLYLEIATVVGFSMRARILLLVLLNTLDETLLTFSNLTLKWNWLAYIRIILSIVSWNVNTIFMLQSMFL